MKLLMIFIFIFTSLTFANDLPKISIVKTGQAKSLEGLIYEDGSLFKTMMVNHVAFIIQYKNRNILFDTGLGDQIDHQFSKDMPFWAKPLFKYIKTQSVKNQVKNMKFDQVILSHTHWDHASGIRDFLDVPIYIDENEFGEFSKLVKNRTLMSQFRDVELNKLIWEDKQYLMFPKHIDLFGDKRVVLVPLYGHSFGSIGLIINSTQKYFFVGDSIWTTRQLEKSSHKSFLSSLLVDRNKSETFLSIKIIKQMKRDGYKIIPTHDYYVQEEIGYYPSWFE